MALKSWNRSSRNPKKIEMLGGTILGTWWDLLAELNFWQTKHGSLFGAFWGIAPVLRSVRNLWGCDLKPWVQCCSTACRTDAMTESECARLWQSGRVYFKHIETSWRLMKIDEDWKNVKTAKLQLLKSLEMHLDRAVCPTDVGSISAWDAGSFSAVTRNLGSSQDWGHRGVSNGLNRDSLHPRGWEFFNAFTCLSNAMNAFMTMPYLRFHFILRNVLRIFFDGSDDAEAPSLSSMATAVFCISQILFRRNGGAMAIEVYTGEGWLASRCQPHPTTGFLHCWCSMMDQLIIVPWCFMGSSMAVEFLCWNFEMDRTSTSLSRFWRPSWSRWVMSHVWERF